MGKKLWAAARRQIRAGLLFMVLMFLLSPNGFAHYSIGLVGIGCLSQTSRDMNFDNYIDMRDKRDPIAYAQDVFTEIMNVELPSTGLSPIDMTERAAQARRDEMMIQISMGNPSPALKLFPVSPDFLIYGDISNFTISHRESMGGNNIAVEADLAVRIVDASNGKTVFVATGKGKSSTHGVNTGEGAGKEKISVECWHDSLEKALMQIAEKIKKAV